MAGPTKSRSQIAQEAYEAERANAQKTLDDARSEAVRANKTADEAVVEAAAAKAKAAKARENMRLEDKGEGVREDGSIRRAGQGPNWTKAKQALEAAEAAETNAKAKEDRAVANAAAARGAAANAEAAIKGMTGEAVRAAQDADKASAQRRTLELATAFAAGAGVTAATAMSYGRQLANATKKIDALIPKVNTTTADGRAAARKIRAEIASLEKTGALKAANKAVTMLGAGAVFTAGAFVTGYLADGARANGNDGMAYFLDTLQRFEQGAAVAAYALGGKASVQALAGKPLGRADQHATIAEAESKLKTDNSARADREKIANAKRAASAAKKEADRLAKAAKVAERDAKIAKSKAERNAAREAAKAIRDARRADTMKKRQDAAAKASRTAARRKGFAAGYDQAAYEGRRRDANRAKVQKIEAGKTEAFGKGRTKGRAEVRAEVKTATRTAAVKQAAKTRGVTAQVESFKAGRTTGRREAFREARIALDPNHGKVVRSNGPLPTETLPPAPRSTQMTMVAAKSANAQIAGRARAMAGMTSPVIGTTQNGGQVVKGGRAGKVGTALAIAAVAGSAISSFMSRSAEATQQGMPRQSYTRVDGKITTGTQQQVEKWNRQKAKA